MKKGMICLLLSVLLSAAFFCAPVRAEEVPGEEQGLLLLEEPEVPELLEAEPAAVISIDRVKRLPEGSMGVTFRGTVVWTEAESVLVQDDTGSIFLTVSQTLWPGDVVLVTGQTGQEEFLVETLLAEGTGPLPAAELGSLADLPEGLRVVIRGGILKDGVLMRDGCRVPVSADKIPEGTADVYGILLGETFYADTIVPAGRPNREWNVYYGLLDAHTAFSDGLGSVEEAFSTAAAVEGLDFFAVTDHSDSFDNAANGSITRDGSAVSAEWAAGKQAAAAVTGENFVGIFGYEMSWSEDKMLGHINTFHTPGWQTPRQPGMGTLAGYCAALAKVPGAVSQFNHPGLMYGEFDCFQDYDPACDRVMQLLQVEGEDGASFYPYYLLALDAGWHVAPTVGQDNHSADWGTAGSSRTAVLAESLTEEALYEAMGACRVYATQDPDLYIDYRLNGQIMGSILSAAEGLEVRAVLEDPTDGAVGTVEVISTGGSVLASCKLDTSAGEVTLPLPDGYPYYFLRITQADGDVAVTAPVWVDDYKDVGILSFQCDAEQPLAGQTLTLELTLFNRELVPFTVTDAVLMGDGEILGNFTQAGDLRYTCPLRWERPGQLRLTAVVRGTVNGSQRSYEKELILHFAAPDPVQASIRQTRNGTEGTAYAIEGYATSGNTNPYTTFPDMIYVQDDTGGIPVRGTFTQKIQIGTPLRITGVLREGAEERYLELAECQTLTKTMRRYTPRWLSCREAADYALRGGSLVGTEGTVTEVTLSADGKGVERFTLRDSRGDTAEAVIDEEIRSGAYGVNRLAGTVTVGSTVRVIGLLSREADGQTVLRVRNCDEVVAVAARQTAPAAVVADESNPPTGDGQVWFLLFGLLRKLG